LFSHVPLLKSKSVTRIKTWLAPVVENFNEITADESNPVEHTFSVWGFFLLISNNTVNPN